MAANPLQEFQSVFVRQPQVGQDNPEFPGREGLDGFFGRIRRGGEESVPLQELGQQVVQVHIVIYYQDGFVHDSVPFRDCSFWPVRTGCLPVFAIALA